jgi:phosphopantothenoylcysteine decarboxylase/phosphopantothenate--cysteine ligase
MHMSLQHTTIILGVSGSIAAYKSPMLVRSLVKQGADVHAVITPSATEFVTPLVLANLSRHAVAVNMFDENVQRGGSWHIELARKATAMVIAPASAKTIAALAHGITDTTVSCVALALPEHTPLFIAPAMDTEMWDHPVTQHNLSILKERGVHVIPPVPGELASGSVGMGRMEEPEVIATTVASALANIASVVRAGTVASEVEPQAVRFGDDLKQMKSVEVTDVQIQAAAETTSSPLQEAIDSDAWNAELMFTRLKNEERGASIHMSDTGTLKPLRGKMVLVTAGPTRERIDDVRFLSNYSTGTMGYAIAEEAAALGAKVVLVSGPVSLPTPAGVSRIDVESASEMLQAVTRYMSEYHIAILAAAVADFAPAQRIEGKIKKDATAPQPALELARTPDVLATLGAAKKDNQILVGFALESENEIDNGNKKLKAKNCDMIVVNSSSPQNPAMGSQTNQVTLLKRGDAAPVFVPRISKRDCARIILASLPTAIVPASTNS